MDISTFRPGLAVLDRSLCRNFPRRRRESLQLDIAISVKVAGLMDDIYLCDP